MFDINFYKDVKTFGPDNDKDTAVKSSLREIEYIFKNLDHNNGNVLEFGVFEGRSLKKIRSLTKNKTFGFDSFIGLPEDWSINSDDGDVYKKGHFNLEGKIPNIENVEFYKGFFEDTIPIYLSKEDNIIDFLHIDVDLYSSSKFILSSLNKFIVPGTIIRFDELTDWRLVSNNFDFLQNRPYKDWKDGEWKSLVEWISEYDRIIEPISRNFTFSSTIRVIR